MSGPLNASSRDYLAGIKCPVVFWRSPHVTARYLQQEDSLLCEYFFILKNFRSYPTIGELERRPGPNSSIEPDTCPVAVWGHTQSSNSALELATQHTHSSYNINPHSRFEGPVTPSAGDHVFHQ